MPRVSFITASYNYEDYIKETITSIQKQSEDDWELIIVDDGSTDNSVSIIKSFCEKDNRIKLFQHENNVNKGLDITLQLGISKAQGEWVAFVESDDTITPDYLRRKFDVINKYPDIKFIFNDVNMFGDEKIIKKYDCEYFRYFYRDLNKLTYPANVSKLFRMRNIVPTFSCVMLKKEILLDVDYNSPKPKLLDYYLWSQLAYKYEFYYIDEKLTNWRMSPLSYINKREKNKSTSTLLFTFNIVDNLTGRKFILLNRLYIFFIWIPQSILTKLIKRFKKFLGNFS